MSSRWLLVPLLIPLLSSIAFSQKLINGFTREFAIQGLPTGFSLKSFDVTGDSVSELFVLTSNQLWVFDGTTFSMIFKDSTAPGTANLSSADVNRDGNADLVANSSDSAVVVWYGPDFSNRNIFLAPRRGFGAFATRNREDGQAEFSFGFGHIHYGEILCVNGYDSTADIDGHVLRYIDTTFVFSDSIHMDGAPTLLEINSLTNANDDNIVFIDLDINYRPCMPTYYSEQMVFGFLDSTVTNVGSVGIFKSPWGPCPPPFSLRSLAIGYVDSDIGAEFIVFVTQPPCFTQGTLDLRVYDMLTSTLQWRRTDSLLINIRSLLTLDLNGDVIQELVSYEIQNSKPGLVEYRTSDGTTLGFTELPFTPATFLADLFGDPPAPKVLLGHRDSLVVYRIGCAANKGDINADGNVTVFDVTLELNCAFLGEGNCNLCFADVNCDGVLTAVDVVLELLAVFLGRPFPCS